MIITGKRHGSLVNCKRKKENWQNLRKGKKKTGTCTMPADNTIDNDNCTIKYRNGFYKHTASKKIINLCKDVSKDDKVDTEKK